MEILQDKNGWFFAGDGLFSNLSSDLSQSIQFFLKASLVLLIGIAQLVLVTWFVHGLRRKYLKTMDAMLVPDKD